MYWGGFFVLLPVTEAYNVSNKTVSKADRCFRWFIVKTLKINVL